MEERSGTSPAKDEGRPTLLPSPFPNEPTSTGGGTEGYEGERLHEMFLAAKRGLQADQDTTLHARDSETNDTDSMYDPGKDGPSFDPFFTVVEDNVTGEQHHPHVYYVFSDDDPELLTNVLLHTINRESETETPESAGSRDDPANEQRIHERYILLDMASDGKTVVSARSLAHDWQILDHQVTTAPTFSESPGEGETGIMLRIQGREKPKQDVVEKLNKQSGQKEASEADLLESMDRLVEQFHDEMDVLRRLATSDKHFDTFDESGDT